MKEQLKPEHLTELARTVQRYRELHPQVVRADIELNAHKPRHGDSYNEVFRSNHAVHKEFDQCDEDLSRLVKVVCDNAAEVEAGLKLVGAVRAALK